MLWYKHEYGKMKLINTVLVGALQVSLMLLWYGHFVGRVSMSNLHCKQLKYFAKNISNKFNFAVCWCWFDVSWMKHVNVIVNL